MSSTQSDSGKDQVLETYELVPGDAVASAEPLEASNLHEPDASNLHEPDASNLHEPDASNLHESQTGAVV
jgi:hypothetical protein